jgi:hypothetical protein
MHDLLLENSSSRIVYSTSLFWTITHARIVHIFLLLVAGLYFSCFLGSSLTYATADKDQSVEWPVSRLQVHC